MQLGGFCNEMQQHRKGRKKCCCQEQTDERRRREAEKQMGPPPHTHTHTHAGKMHTFLLTYRQQEYISKLGLIKLLFFFTKFYCYNKNNCLKRSRVNIQQTLYSTWVASADAKLSLSPQGSVLSKDLFKSSMHNQYGFHARTHKHTHTHTHTHRLKVLNMKDQRFWLKNSTNLIRIQSAFIPKKINT